MSTFTGLAHLCVSFCICQSEMCLGRAGDINVVLWSVFIVLVIIHGIAIGLRDGYTNGNHREDSSLAGIA